MTHMTHTMVKRSAQSVLHLTLSREEADRIGEQIADRICTPTNFQQAVARYNTNDEFEIGEAAAREYVTTCLA